MAVAAFAAGLWGCGSADDYARIPVQGRITLDGRPLESGTISFAPLNAGPSTQGAIADGAYAIGRSTGPAAGTYRVEIHSMRPTGRRVPDNDNPGETIEEVRNAIPDRYNVRSELRAEVKTGAGTPIDFALESRGDETKAKKKR